MLETKGQFKERLKQEGKWDEFLELRDEFKNAGYEPKVAYALAADRIGAIAGVADSGSVSEDGLGLAGSLFEGKSPAGTRQIVQWVFDNIDIEDVRAESAPSPGAWSLLQRVRKYPELLKEFYRSIWTRILPSKAEIDNTGKFEDDGREQLELIDKIQQAARDAVLSSGSQGL